jgi:hypothetical protein
MPNSFWIFAATAMLGVRLPEARRERYDGPTPIRLAIACCWGRSKSCRSCRAPLVMSHSKSQAETAVKPLDMPGELWDDLPVTESDVDSNALARILEATEAERGGYRELLVAALDGWHAAIAENTRLYEQNIALREELRERMGVRL